MTSDFFEGARVFLYEHAKMWLDNLSSWKKLE